MSQTEQDWSRFLPPFDSTSDPELAATFSNRKVCIVGGAGDIGSAIAKALFPTTSLVLFDSSEHGLFELRREFESLSGTPACDYVLGNMCDRQTVDFMLRRFRPDIIFHAAAYKHVGMLEENAFTAIHNNVFGTDTLLQSAAAHSVETVVLLSTDKAVKPHSAMGVSKRLAEMLALSYSSSSFRVSAVRLGNVIGSRGSVVPIFLDRILKKQCLRVTDPAATRYFISRGQAVAAILQAGRAACDGVVLLPNLGEPVPIAELAAFLLKTYDPNADLSLCFSGLRPGEKLSEDLIGDDEYKCGAVEGSLTVLKGTITVSPARMLRLLSQADLVSQLQELVPEYVPSELMLRGAH